MDENRRQIERDISAERRALDRNLSELQDKAKALGDWRVHYRNHPGVALGLAFGTGVVLAAVVGGSSGPRMREEEPDSERAFFEPKEPRRRPQGPFRSQVNHQVNDFWQKATYALLSLAAAKAVDFVATRIPGFREEFDHCDDVEIPGHSASVH